MHSDISPDIDGSASDAARRAGMAIVITAAIVLAGDCLLNCPGRFSEAHEKDTSLLRPVVSMLGLFGKFGTQRGVEVRNLVFFTGAAGVSIIAGLCLALGSIRSRYSIDDLLDGRSRAASPVFWWIVLLIVSALSSIFSHAPAFCQGQMIVRLLQFAWWWPIATILSPRQTRALSMALVTVLGVTAAIGLAYHFMRIWPGQHDARLQYPLGNELWMAACILPGAFIGGGLGVGWLKSRPRKHMKDSSGQDAQRADAGSFVRVGFVVVLVALIMIALVMTRSRSAAVGMVAGTGACIIILLPARRRLPALLAMCIVAIAASLLVQQMRVEGSTGGRAHSIRARLDYEWPYAMRLFMGKPVAGNGDGAYSLLAGQFGREDQLDDPGVMRFDETSWPAHAHNEFLELLADLGLAGAIAFFLALGIPIYRAARYFQNSAECEDGCAHRWVVLGLTGALIAMVFEACGTPAIREPGAGAVFVTVWACLWAAVRRQGRPSREDPDDKPIAIATVRLFGLAMCVGAAVLGYRGAQDWWAMRARFDAADRMSTGHFADAIPAADFAVANTLDPFQRASALMISAWSRSLFFDQLLSTSDRPPDNDEMDVSGFALMSLSALERAAPRFLQVSRLKADIFLNRARAYSRRGDLRNEAECRQNLISALEASRSDEPFLIDRVQALWRAKPAATTTERLLWLRCLLRGGEVDPAFDGLLRTLMAAPDFGRTLGEFTATAAEDAKRPSAQWRDRLSPESMRIAAMAYALQSDFAGASKSLVVAEELYQAGLPQLFAGYGATIHDAVRLRITQDPNEHVDENLAEVERAYRAAHGSLEPGSVIPDPTLGRTRALLLVIANREADARIQLKASVPSDDLQIERVLSTLYLQLASILIDRHQDDAPRALVYANRAADLAPDSPRPLAICAELVISIGDGDSAVAYLRRLAALPHGDSDLRSFLAALHDRYAQSSVWPKLMEEFPGMLPTTSSAPAD